MKPGLSPGGQGSFLRKQNKNSKIDVVPGWTPALLWVNTPPGIVRTSRAHTPRHTSNSKCLPTSFTVCFFSLHIATASAFSLFLSLCAFAMKRDAETRLWLQGLFPPIFRYHDYLHGSRSDPDTGLVYTYHPWETEVAPDSAVWDALLRETRHDGSPR